MFQYIFYLLLAYLLYRLIFNFIIPVYRTTKKVRKGFREMQEKMNQHQAQQQNGYQTHSAQQNKDEIKGDYIDFEEVK